MSCCEEVVSVFGTPSTVAGGVYGTQAPTVYASPHGTTAADDDDANAADAAGDEDATLRHLPHSPASSLIHHQTTTSSQSPLLSNQRQRPSSAYSALSGISNDKVHLHFEM